MKCCICGNELDNEWGNNPWPVNTEPEAKCCSACNIAEVIPARLELMMKNKNNSEEIIEESSEKPMIEVGDKIRILGMAGEPQYKGKEGEVTLIDDAGQIHGTWGGCAIIPEEDEFEVLNKNYAGLDD